jgi:hypothetical protein
MLPDQIPPAQIPPDIAPIRLSGTGTKATRDNITLKLR